MSESLVTAGKNASKEERYELLIPQLKALVEGEPDLIANLANIMAALKDSLNVLWVGVYFVKDDELVLGPFQGPLACTRIAFGKGVCGAAWQQDAVIIVPDVDLYPGHIACSSLSRSEIVLPVRKNGKVNIILDIDSEHLAYFNETDKANLLKVTALIESLL